MDEFELTHNPAGNDCGGEKVETIKEPMVEYGVARFALPGQGRVGRSPLGLLYPKRNNWLPLSMLRARTKKLQRR